MSDKRRTFRDRRDAGQVLARDLAPYLAPYQGPPNGLQNLLVLGLARGGVPIAAEVARALNAPLDVCLVRKLGVPQWPELAMGAVATGGGVVLNHDLLRSLGINDEQVRDAITRETAELHRRELAYRGGRGPLEVTGRVVVLVDDGIATGASMVAAVRSVREAGAEQVVVGAPVGPATVCRLLREEADQVVCSTMPGNFQAVGQVFADFHQVSDDEVRQLLAVPH
ncbi:phosphoribosyltransferase [Mycolicibacterium sp. BiH015]|uniref:phosphoribosyltransferase n=1 Tax=Mycolicibacterium sp. BiH015 TaxID=3018808 RepID=UPI0022E8E68B|nr:phosphoribosyltransferase [Mycolicibacterium sp. BiH015]MDA2890437.1 phosphoribosyltransferase [Mycolicibacterium sp. BiH015]